MSEPKQNEPKQCKKCKEFSKSFYSKTVCWSCRKKYLKEYYQNNKNKIKKYKKKYRENNKKEIAHKKKEYYLKNKNKIKKYKQKYEVENKNNILEKKREYYLKNKNVIIKKTKDNYKKNKKKYKKYYSDYYNKNKNKIKKRNKEYINKRIKKDAVFKLRKSVSLLIRLALQKEGALKKTSCIKKLPYTIQELKNHLESQFEPWMNWDNWGIYDKESWDDDDSSTWTWQIDHIIPQSKLPYDSMDHPNFKKCWALSNLRPLKSKENLTKSNKEKKN